MSGGRAERLWAARTWQSDLLLPAAWLFGTLAALRRQRYRSGLAKPHRLAVPVIVVGNIVVGGTGKTPLVIALVKALQSLGYHPGVISRGYGGALSRDKQRWSMVDASDPVTFGDEIVLIQKLTQVPCAVGALRTKAGQGLLQRHPEIDVVLSDDGLQHYPMARDIDLVVFDQRGIGNGRLLPAGPLREPISRLKEVDAVVLNGPAVDLAPAWLPHDVPVFRMQLQHGKPWQLVDPARSGDLSQFRGTSIHALAGIGDPTRFFSMLEQAGLEIDRTPLSDHFEFAADLFTSIRAEVILITEKDAVKCSMVADPRIWVVPVAANLDAALIQLLLEKLVAPR